MVQRMIAAGTRVPEIEAALVQAGLDRNDAEQVVDDVLSARTAQIRPGAERSINRGRIVMGLMLAAVGFVVAYWFLSSRAQDMLEGRIGPMQLKLLAVPGGVIAAVGLKIVRSALMSAWQSDD
jgi:hypothetical protein